MRKKELDMKEKMVFKEIALDYAKRRLEILESEEEKKEPSNEYVRQRQTPRTQTSKVKRDAPHSNSTAPTETRNVITIDVEDESKKPRSQQYLRQQQQSSPRGQQVKRKQNATCTSIADDFDSFEAAKKACFSGSKTPKARSRKTSEETTPSSSQKRGKFTFRRSETLTSSPSQQRWMGKSPAAKISEGRLKLRQGDDLSEPLSSSSRNNIALSDSKVVSPRMARNVDGKKSRTPKSTGKNKNPSPSQQSNLDVWISSRAKSKEENKPFTFSSKLGRGAAPNSTDLATSDDDLVCISDESDGETMLPSDDNTRGGFMNDVLSLQNINPRTQKRETSHIDNSGTHTPRQPASGDSGHCLNAAPVDKYGLTRRWARKEDRQKDSDSDSTLSGIRDQKSDTMVECPLCLGMYYISCESFIWHLI